MREWQLEHNPFPCLKHPKTGEDVHVVGVEALKNIAPEGSALPTLLIGKLFQSSTSETTPDEIKVILK